MKSDCGKNISLELLQKKDPEAFRSLYDYYAPALYGVLLDILQEAELSDALLQQVFVQAWQEIHLYESKKLGIFTWLCQKARMLALETKNRCEEKRENEDGTNLRGVRGILSKLEAQDAEIIRLVYYQNCDVKQVASRLEISLSEARVAILRAMAELGKAIANQ